KAKQAGMVVDEYKESQDICFIKGCSCADFLSERIGSVTHGAIVDEMGKRLGTHQGIPFYTVGQRGGLGISAKRPLYVVEIDNKSNTIIVGEKGNLLSIGLIADRTNIFFDKQPTELIAKIRYAHKGVRCVVHLDKEKIFCDFENPQEAVSKGQSVVFYHGDVVWGGGIICEVIK
ncbi:MAG: tRNA methyl transferase PRC-barrel domain-containing protein, partial [Deltaproteobacteria bacterium]